MRKRGDVLSGRGKVKRKEEGYVGGGEKKERKKKERKKCGT